MKSLIFALIFCFGFPALAAKSKDLEIRQKMLDEECQMKLGVHAPKQLLLDYWGPNSGRAADARLNAEIQQLAELLLANLKNVANARLWNLRLPVETILLELPVLNLTGRLNQEAWDAMDLRERRRHALHELFTVRPIGSLDDAEFIFSEEALRVIYQGEPI